MARVDISLAAVGGDVFRNLSRRMKDAGARDLQNAMRRNMRRVAGPVVSDIRAAYLALPDVSEARREGPQARQAVAGAVRLQTLASANRASIKFVVDRRRLPEDRGGARGVGEQAGLATPGVRRPGSDPGAVDVGGAGDPAPQFYRVICRHRDDFRAACLEAMDEGRLQLNGRGG